MRLRLEEGSRTLIKFDRARNRDRLSIKRVPKMIYNSFKGDGALLCICLKILKANHVYLNYDCICQYVSGACPISSH